jgi:hypothetical protein
MSPSRWVGLSAFLAIAAALSMGAAVSHAQTFMDDARQSLDWLSDPTVRSPRLLGMGRLTLVIPEPNNDLSLWDYAGMTAGLGDSDSASTVEFRPSTSAASTLHDIFGQNGARQSLAARDVMNGIEAWRRAKGETTFGLTGDFGLLRTDEPFSQTIEQRNHFSRPRIMPAINGNMPFILTDRIRYGLRGIYSLENRKEEFRSFVVSPSGEYLDQNGDLLQPQDLFKPEQTEVSTTGLGASARYEAGPWLRAGVGFDAMKSEIRSMNVGIRHGSFIDEDRPVLMGQAVLRGLIGSHFEWIADGRTWTSNSEPSWRFTTSAGQGATPLSGRGKLLERDEEGQSVRSRVRLFSGPIELGGSFHSGYRKIDITPPDPNDRSSFNYFRNITFHRQNADSIFLPDSVVANSFERRSWEAGVGASWRAPWRGALIGVEYHMAEASDEQVLNGEGPKRKRWDVRTGVELPLGEVLTGRGGFIYRSDDRDDLTLNNEFVSNAVTLGLGVRPPGRSWAIESGYAYEWFRGDYPDPISTRGTRNQFNAQVRWEL